MATSTSQLAKRWFEEVWNLREDATVEQLLHPDVQARMEGLEVRSAADFLAARAGLLAAFPDLHVTVEAVLSEGEEAVVRWSAVGSHVGEGLGIPPSSKRVMFRGMTWLTFSEGRIVKGWDSWNQGMLLQELMRPASAPIDPPAGNRKGI